MQTATETKNRELLTHRKEHNKDNFEDDCIFCLVDDEDHEEHDKAKAFVYIVGEDYANKEDMDEAYQGEFSSNAEFAQETAESMGDIPRAGDTNWPLYCIDWEQAARDLMMDYSEQDGYYFRNL